MRTLALDVGDRRIGVAVSDALGITAQGLETYWRTESTKKDVAYILTLMTARRVLLDADVSRGKQKKVIDKLAAVVILQGYMESHPGA